ncbi:MAG: hypothetical protein K2I88_05505, partial [Anaeroplasmataceae bacterium]|nr:hypothetical protein [Anaeroplasmataceae bacterium]
MSKHQKRVLITNACGLSGIILTFSGIALMNIFGFCIQDKNLAGKLILGALILVIMGFIFLIIATRTSAKFAIHGGYLRTMFPPSLEYFASAGVPNNSLTEFDLPITKFLPEVLQAQEIIKGVYEIHVDEQKYVFNMKGWIHKEYYIYEIILTKIQTKFMPKG